MQAWWAEDNSLKILLFWTGNVHFVFSKQNYTGSLLLRLKVTIALYKFILDNLLWYGFI